jgi:hypothetical protein
MKVLQELAAKVTNLPFTMSCKNCIQDAKILIKNNLNKQEMKTTERKSQYILRDGNHYFPALAMHVSNKNLTDELAIQIVELNPKNAAYFLHAPKIGNPELGNKEIIVIPAKGSVQQVVKTEKEQRDELIQILDAKGIKYAKNYSFKKLKSLLEDKL